MASPYWCFAEFRLDPDNSCLWRGAHVVPLTPKAFDVLHYLVTHPDRVVTKDALLDAVWPTTAVTDVVVRMAIGELRRALGDTAQASQYIATVQRRGYRFVALVTPGTSEAAPPAVPSPSPPLALVPLPAPEDAPPASGGRDAPPEELAPWRCAVCRQPQAPAARFCVACGTPRAETCSACGQAVSGPATFCPGCGQRLAALPPGAPAHHLPVPLALAGERKQVTVLFADLKDSLALIRDLDPEAAQQLLDPALHAMMDAVHRYEGTVNQVLGDGIMALFGAPLAHEDHAVRACYAALAMQAALRAYAEDVHRTHGLALQSRIGINSGEVVVRTISHDLHMDYSAVGQTTHLAARMQQVAAPDTVVLTVATARLAEGFVQVRALEPVPVRGLPAPVAVFELHGASAVHSRFQAAVIRGLTRFVGRELELATLQQALERASAGHGQVVAVVGEPGMGKTRLAYEGVQDLRRQGWLVLESAVASYGQGTPYFPVVELLQCYFHLKEGEAPPAIQTTVTGQVLALDETLQGTVPALLALLDALPDDSPFWQLEPVPRRRRIQEALKQLLVRASQAQPVVLVVENLHWIDTETQAWLDTLVESLPAAPLLLLVNYRPEYQHGWGSKTYYTQLRLDPLPPTSATALVQDLVGTDPDLEPLARRLIAHTEGNPFFLEESVRTLVEMQALVGRRGAYHLTQALPTIQMPATVQAVLTARIDRLPPAAKRLLQTAAVIGTEVPLPVLHAVVELPEEAVQQSLTHVQAAEFLYETRLFPTPVYTFKHALTQQAAYQSLLISTRQQLHGQIAQILETQCAAMAETQPERLAHHYTEAGLGAQAVGYWQRAGQRAMERSAQMEAINHLSRGLEVLSTMPDMPERAQYELDLQLPLGAAWAQARGWAAPEVGQVYARARALCQCLGESLQLPIVLLGQFVGCFHRAELQTARELAEHLFTLAQRQSDPVLLLEAHTTLGSTLLVCGEVVAAHAHVAQGSALYVQAYHRTLVARHGLDFGVVVRCFAALSLWLLGAPHQALAQVHQAHTMAQELSHPYSLAFALTFVMRLCQWRRDVPATLTWAETLIALCTEHSFRQYLYHGRLLYGWVRSTQGQTAEGINQMRQSVMAYQGTIELWRPYGLALLAEGYAKVGAADEGRRVLAEARASVQHTGERVWEAELHRLKGELLQARHPHPAPGGGMANAAEAEACFQQALAVARRQQAKALELRAATSLARLWQHQGKQTKARQLLAPIYGWFTEGFDTADLQEARALLEALT
jgi:class 3 adenylate cyclase/DNA-binding winged helix-turn-helix (wHTH) protein/predicted ATPase